MSAEKIRVLQVIRRTRVGGDKQVIYEIVARADPSRFEFEVAADDDGPYFERFEGVAERVHRAPFNSWRPLSPRITSTFKKIIRGRVDVVHLHGLPMGYVLGLLPAANGTPVVYTNHVLSSNYREGVKGAVMHRVERWAYGRMAAVTFVNPGDLEAARADGLVPEGTRTPAIANGIDVGLFRHGPGSREARERLGIPEGVTVVGCVGRVHYQKNPELFARAARGLAKIYPEARFVWIGSPAEDMRRIADGLGLGERFVLPGHVDRVEELLPAMDVFLLTSRWEGLPLVVAEALAAGVPVVASDAGGITNVIRAGENGLLFPSGDEAAAVAATKRLLEDERLAGRLVERGLEDVQAFDVRRMVREYEDLYQSLAGDEIARREGDGVQKVDSTVRRTSEKVDVLGVGIDPLTVRELHLKIARFIEDRDHALVLHANAHGLNLSYRDASLRGMLNGADVVFCDGAGVMLGARILGQRIPERITYADWMWHLAAFAEERGFSVFLLGARPGVAQKAAGRLEERFPGLRVVGVHHGYFDRTPGSAENEAVVEKINAASPDILVVGYGMPLQEFWLRDNWENIEARVALTGGAVYDYVSGKLRRGPRFLTKYGLESVARLLVEPRRLWRRYVVGNPLFLFRVLKQRLARAAGKARDR